MGMAQPCPARNSDYINNLKTENQPNWPRGTTRKKIVQNSKETKVSVTFGF